MEIAFAESVAVKDTSSVGEVRRGALAAADRLGFDATRAGELALLATEATRNTLVHGGGGQVILAGITDGGSALARILAIDQGVGIADITRAMEDGYSTAGTPGGGMGAMKRIASTFEVFTGSGGTILLLELGRPAADRRLHMAAAALPYPGERFCGDGWHYHYTPERAVALLVDGLGHGWEASEAAQEAIATFRRRIDSAPGKILSYVHDALKKTRGAVAAVAEIRPQERSLVYAGVGNISAVVLSGGTSRSLVSHNGTLGATTSRIQEFRAEWPPDAILIMHSDGVQSRWDLSAYPGLIARHPAVIGGALLRDFRRQRDDASVVVVKAA